MPSDAAQAIPSYLREINERRVLDALRQEGPAHAAEVARLAGLSRPTAAQVLRSLMEAGLVAEVSPTASDSKRAKTMYKAISTLGLAMSVDIGARFVRAAVANLNGEVLASEKLSNSNTTLKKLLADVDAVIDQTLSAAGKRRDQVLSCVVGSPGVVEQESGRIAIAGTIEALDGIHLGEVIGHGISAEPFVENDVNLATVAEQNYGHGQGVANFAVISIGSGIGSGLVLNHSLHRGTHGAAGEIFYVPFGELSDTHRLQTDPSGPNISEVARALAPKYPQTRVSEPYEPAAVFDAARFKDGLALAVIENIAERIARYIAAITAVVDVEIVVLQGGVGRQSEVMLAEIQAVVSRLVPFAPTIVVSKLGETAVLMGGIALSTKLAQDSMFAKRSNAYQAAREVS